MNTIILKIFGGILGMKFGWIIAIIAGIVLGLSLLKNIVSGSFSIAKFAGGFNIFAGGVQGKLIYYGVLIILAIGLYHQLTRATWNYNTDYKNNVTSNRDVYLDQRVGDTCTDKCILAVQPFGFTLLKVGCVNQCTASITQTTKTQEPTIAVPVTPIEDKTVKKTDKVKKGKK